MSYHANITAALYLVNDIMPRVWAKRPTIRVTIAGKDPSHEIMSLVARYPSLVAVTGAVPDIRPYLGRAAVAVSPVAYGAGIQNKVLEAMAMGTPVVASSQAVSALQARDGEHLLVGNGVEGFAQAVLRLLEDRELQARIGRAGRRYVEGHHDWLGIVQRLEEFYGSSLGRERTVEQGAR
jgi:glycosyltransferase involved in cell wall biosynthesis